MVFTATRRESEEVAEQLSEQLGADTRVWALHGDMPQAQRQRVMAGLRGGGRPVVMVATDVVARGLDVAGVDLVVQMGVPRKAGKKGTYDGELYVHRAGRAGRMGSGEHRADSVVLWDPADGERGVVEGLSAAVGVQFETMEVPTADQLRCDPVAPHVLVSSSVVSVWCGSGWADEHWWW